MTFFICVFILLMQFLWKYIDDLVGKGLEWNFVAELLTYASFGLVPLAFPLAMLLASIMTFGNLGENYELVAMKASGISPVPHHEALVGGYSDIDWDCLLFFEQHSPQNQSRILRLTFQCEKAKTGNGD